LRLTNGFTVIEAIGGPQGVDMVNSHGRSGHLDLRMPDRTASQCWNS